MARRDAQLIQAVLQHWQRAARVAESALATTLSTTDGRWAVVSTMATLAIAGSVAWLAAGTMPRSGRQTTYTARNRSLMPYDLFSRLASQDGAHAASYAAFGPSAAIVTGKPAPNSDFSLDGALAAQQAEDSDTTENTRTVTLDSGDTLAGALINAGVSSDDATAAITALKKVFSPRGLRAGQSFDLTFEPAPPQPMARITYTPPQSAAPDDNTDTSSGDTQDASDSPGKLLQISFSPTVDQDVTVSRTADGGFNAQQVQKKLVARYHRAGATIDSSLYLAAMQAGIPADIVVQMIHIFSYEVDFQRDIHPGDKFQVYYDYYYTPNGKRAKTGNIVYASMKLANRTVSLYRYQPKDGGPAEYYNAKGQSTKSLLMRTPVDGARISSGFGMRFHPVLGYTRMHKGVDFAVPVGTPVMAAGNGVIKYEGPARGYGNFMIIKHNSEYSTAYAHLSRFAPGIHDGTHVHQGEVVAYSGNTGLTTGPHLHYEVRVYGHQVNPMTVKIAGAQKLKGKALQRFLAQRINIDSEMAALPLETKVADAGSGLREAKD